MKIKALDIHIKMSSTLGKKFRHNNRRDPFRDVSRTYLSLFHTSMIYSFLGYDRYYTVSWLISQ
jgi:hypothetical protein